MLSALSYSSSCVSSQHLLFKPCGIVDVWQTFLLFKIPVVRPSALGQGDVRNKRQSTHNKIIPSLSCKGFPESEVGSSSTSLTSTLVKDIQKEGEIGIEILGTIETKTPCQRHFVAIITVPCTRRFELYRNHTSEIGTRAWI
jgi:hypothetical protein